MSIYKAVGNQVIMEWPHGETQLRANCEQAAKAAELLNKAGYLNDCKRKYTAAARLIHQAEQLDGFQWIDGAESQFTSA